MQDAQWDLMASSVVESVRTVFSWAGAQPRGGGTPISFEDTDPVVRRAALRNISVLPVIFYTPTWARAVPKTDDVAGMVPAGSVVTSGSLA